MPQPALASPRLAPPVPAPVGDAADATAVHELTRRIALQRDLTGAVGVIALGLSNLAAASVAVAIVAADGSISSPRPVDLRAAAAVVRLDVVAGIARSTRPGVTPRAIVAPVDASTATGTTAAIIVHRAATAPAFDARDLIVVGAVASQAGPILRGFLVEQANCSARDAADAGGMFRVEALRTARAGGHDGKPVFLSATWLRWAYPTVLGMIVVVIAAAAVMEVPSYSSGPAIVSIDGEEITCPTGGTVASVSVGPGETIAAGDELVRLHAIDEEAELARVDAEYRVALSSFLFDPADQVARAQLSTIASTRQRAQAAVDSRVIRATRAGVVGDVRVRPGALLLPGTHVLSIVDQAAQPSIVALLPGSDRPRLQPGMTLQVHLVGFTRSRQSAVITEVGSEVIGPTEARRYLGETVGDALPIAGPVVIVRARLAARTFATGGHTYAFHDGMPGLGEVRIESRSFLRTLIAKD